MECNKCVDLLNDKMDLHTNLVAWNVGKLFTYKPMCLYVRGVLIFGNKPMCIYARKYGDDITFSVVSKIVRRDS